jgi:Ca2+-binding RTX toxin-like protein
VVPIYRGTVLSRLVGSFVGALLALAVPATANAATLSIAGSTVSFAAADGETNDVTVALAAGAYTITDAGAPLNAGPCTQLTANSASCTAGGITALSLDARDRDDRIVVASVAVPVTLIGAEGDDVLTGGDGGDTLNGGAGADRLDGAAGNDTLNGDSGDDRMVGGTGNDVLNGGTGTDTADFTARTASLTISIDGTANDGAPGETDNVKTDVENVEGGSGNDVLIGGTANNVLNGGGGHDSLDGDAGNDTLDGAAGDDDLTGGAGTDLVTYSARVASIDVVLDGGGGNGEIGEDDTIHLDVESATGGSAGDSLRGGPNADTLSGGPGSDTLKGEGGNDTLSGDDGDDVLDGGAGSDVHNGGAGFDIADYSARTTAVTADLDGAADDGETVEADNVKPDVEEIDGGSGDDTLTGNNAVNVLRGAQGDDTLDPGRGSGDRLVGGSGADTVTYSARTAAVSLDLDGAADDGEAGEADLIESDVENLTGGGGNDRLTGGAGTNLLSGGAGNDVLDGGAGSDLLLGGTGIDTADYSLRSAPVAADPDGISDDGEAAEGDDVETDVEGLAGGSGNDVLTGWTGTNVISGGAGNDVLNGEQGDDTLDGGPGDDQITGGAGLDIIDGGAGADALRARDGATDQVRCGADGDAAVLDAIDDAASDCETRDVPADAPVTGPQGPAGPSGSTGATGGPGAGGATGATGAPGPAGRDATVTCTPGPAKKGKVTVTCKVQLAAKASALRGRFMNGGRVAATGHGTAGAFKLDSGHLQAGRYTLVLTYTVHGRRTTVRRRVLVA